MSQVAVVWKFELQITDWQEVLMPIGAEILSVANQGEKLCLWAMVNPIADTSLRVIDIMGTGNFFASHKSIPHKFVGTVLIGRFVWHVFERVYLD